MPKRSSKKKPEEPQQPVVPESAAQGTTEPQPKPAGSAHDGKNPAAVALGRLGGRKGGPARAAKLSKERRSEIAKQAAFARWAKKRKAT